MSESLVKRIRRTPEDARRLILDAAEVTMAKAGPAGLRLQDVAEAAGVSHPTILHHFESRDGLIRAVHLRSIEHLRQTLQAAMSGADSSTRPVLATFEAFRDGLAQRMLWIVQSTPAGAGGPAVFDEMVEALHGIRLALAKPDETIDIEDTRAIVHLTVVAAFGEALIGSRLRRAPSAEADKAGAERFSAWFAKLIDDQVG